MANWLDKYEQGGLVLKKKTKDNFGKKANPNDVKASVGPDFVGLGYNTKGRNYSPAWGGQFADGGKVYKSKPMAQSSDIKSASNTFNADDFSNYSTIINKYPNMSNDTSYMYARNTPTGTEQFFHNTNQGKPVSQLQRGNKFVNLSPEQVSAYKQKVLTGTGGFAMGGGIPGAVGFTYARVAGSAPANGKYTKKTKASAQNGQEMKFYQEGLDFKPKSISKNGSAIKDDRGQWAYPGEITEIGSNDITMQGVNYPVLGVSDTGDTQIMYPDQDYKFDGDKVTEYPMAQDGRNLSKELQKEAEERLERMKKPKATVSQYTPKKGEQAKFDKQKLEKIAEENAPLNRMAASKGAANMQDAIEAALIMEGGLAAGKFVGKGAKAAGKYLTEETALKNAYKVNPFAFKADPTKYYRQAGKAAYDDAMIEGKMYAKGQKELLEKNPNINYTNEYNASIAADEAGKFHLTKPANAPFVQKGKLFYPIDRKPTGAGYKGTKFADAEYLFEGALPDEAVLPRYQEKYLSSLNQSGGAGVVRPEFNDLDNFKTYQKNWLKGYKEVPKKENGGWLNKYK
jgi:hypothetical protein